MASALLMVFPDLAIRAQVRNRVVVPPLCLSPLTLASDLNWSVPVCVQALARDGGPLRLTTQYGVEGCPGGARGGSFKYCTPPPIVVLARTAAGATDLGRSA